VYNLNKENKETLQFGDLYTISFHLRKISVNQNLKCPKIGLAWIFLHHLKREKR